MFANFEPKILQAALEEDTRSTKLNSVRGKDVNNSSDSGSSESNRDSSDDKSEEDSIGVVGKKYLKDVQGAKMVRNSHMKTEGIGRKIMYQSQTQKGTAEPGVYYCTYINSSTPSRKLELMIPP